MTTLGFHKVGRLVTNDCGTGAARAYSFCGMSLPRETAYMWTVRANHSMRRTGTSQRRARLVAAPSSEGVHMRRTQWLACGSIRGRLQVKDIDDKLWQAFVQLAKEYPDDHGVRMTSDMVRWLMEERRRMTAGKKPDTLAPVPSDAPEST